ncbi:MAG: Gldg family protein, partial [Planctomycetota bacterium]
MENLEKHSFSRANRFKYTANVSVSVILAFILVLMVNYISSRHYTRLDITTIQQHTLSPKTIQILKQLSIPVQILSIQTSSQNPTILYMTQFIQDLTKEFTSHSDVIKVTVLDYYGDNQKVEALSQELKPAGFTGELSEFHHTLVVRMQGKYRILPYGKFFNFERNKERPEFQGEGLLRAIIEELSSDQPRRVLFLEGHGELDSKSDLSQGISLLKEKLLQENMTVNSKPLGEVIPLIQHTELLIIPAPSKAYSEPELQALSLYLESGGKLIVFFDAWEDSNLSTILGSRGIMPRKDQIQYPRELYPTQLSVRRWFSSHPINQSLAQLSGLTVFMDGACSLSLETDIKGYQVQSIAQSDPETFSILSSLRNRPKEILERTGPFPLAAVSSNDQMRLVVFGDSDFIKNGEQLSGTSQRLGLRDGANSDLVLNAINWCLAQEYRLEIDSKPLDLRLIQVDVDTAQRIGFLLCILIPLASVALYWMALDALRNKWVREGLEILEEVLRQPSSFFATSSDAITPRKAFFFPLGIITFLALFFYTFGTHLGFSFISDHPSSSASAKQWVKT